MSAKAKNLRNRLHKAIHHPWRTIKYLCLEMSKNRFQNPRRFLLRNLFKRYMPENISIGLTYTCQCGCPHCGIAKYPKEKTKELKTAEVRDIIDQSLDRSSKLMIATITFFGGEPLLRGDILELIRYAHNRGLMVGLDTNGELLTKTMVKDLKAACLGFVHVSLDSPDPQMHDTLRKRKGLFDKAVLGIGYLVEAGIRCKISTYAHRKNLEGNGLKKIVELGKRLRVNAIRILLPVPSGEWLKKESEVLSPEEEAKVKQVLEPGFIYVYSKTLNHLNFKECPSINAYFYISPYGEVQPCPSVPLSFGNVRQEPLKVIWKRMSSHPMFRDRSLFSECLMRNRDFRRRYIDSIPEGVKLPIVFKE